MIALIFTVIYFGGMVATVLLASQWGAEGRRRRLGNAVLDAGVLVVGLWPILLPLAVVKAWHREPPSVGGDTPEPVRTHQNTEIVAWKAWGLNADIQLEATAAPYTWEGPVGRNNVPPVTGDWEMLVTSQIISCATGRTSSPIPAVGFFARKTREELGHVNLVPQDYGTLPVVGEVALSGTVIEGEHGYRAQCCTIRKLILQWAYVNHSEWRPIDVQAALEERYQCEVELVIEPSAQAYDALTTNPLVVCSAAGVPYWYLHGNVYEGQSEPAPHRPTVPGYLPTRLDQ